MSVSDLCPHGEPPGRSDPSRLTNPGHLAVRVVLAHSEPVSRVWEGHLMVDTYWRAYIVDRPGLALTHAGRRYPYPLEAITVIPPWCAFHFHPVDDLGHAFIHFTVPALARTVVTGAWPTPLHLDDPALLAAMRRMGCQLGFGPRPPEIGMTATALAHRVLLGCVERLDEAERQRVLSPGHQRLEPALNHVDRHLARPIAVSDLATRLGVGDEHCIRLFRRLLGQTPAQYVIDRRVQRAAELLSEPGADIAAVATACGFPNRHYLTRVFARRMGVTPAAYRDQAPVARR